MFNRRGFFKSLAGALVAPICAPLRSQAAVIACLPYVQNVGFDRAVLAWTTEQLGQGAVWLASNGSPARRVTSSVKELLPSDTGLDSPSYRHTAELTGLAPNTEYFYQVTAEDQTLPGSGFHFRTAGSGPFSFLAFGDSGSGLPQQQMLAEWMKKENPALVLHLGDLAYPQGAFLEYQHHYFDVYRDLMKQVPFFPCAGNHGYMTRDGFPYLTLHDVPAVDSAPPAERGRYYSFDWGNAHFAAIDSNAPLVQAAQGRGHMLEWLEHDLSVTQQYWKIVYFHHPPFAGGP
ncbi:MAG TPA: metallophosphoesterase, partial [Terriglobia bacterium]|nr:metallophosphoesterase [Terriglobia bacterium]